MKSFLKKIITVFILCVFTFNTTAPTVNALIIPIPPIPIVSPPLGPVPILDKANTLKEVGITKLGVTIPGVSFDGIIGMATKATIGLLTDSLVQWINDGFDGGPAFATDPADFFLGVADQVAGPFIEDIGLSALCSPFRAQIEGALRISFNSSQVLRERYIGSCTISGIVGNFEDFLSGDFSQGGWQGWITMTQNQDSNPFGAMITAQSTLAARIASATGIAQEELSWSKGFLSSQECTGTGSAKVCVTTTPGTVIEDQLQRALGSELAQLELADEFDELLGALAGQLMGVVFNSTRGLIATNANPPRWAGGGFSDRPQHRYYSCSPDRDSTILENGTADITWTVSGNSPGVVSKTYLWSGDAPIIGATGDKPTVTYTTPGIKTAFVTITETIMRSGVESTVTEPRIQCYPEVEVKKYGPITGICFPMLASDYNSTLNFEQLRAKILRATRADQQGYTLPIVWIVFPKGGSGVYDNFLWKTNVSFFPPADIVSFESFMTLGSVPLHSVSPIGGYYRSGEKTARVKIIDREINDVDVAEITCADFEAI